MKKFNFIVVVVLVVVMVVSLVGCDNKFDIDKLICVDLLKVMDVV